MSCSSPNSDELEDWEKDDLPDLIIPIAVAKQSQSESTTRNENDDDDDGWTPTPSVAPPSKEATKDHNSSTGSTAHASTRIKHGGDGEPMILVDMTELSQGVIHSKFDASSVNDHAAVKLLRLAIESDYASYAKNSSYLASGIVVPCGSSVWRPALVQLRRERPGHYFCPIFPTTS